MRPKTQAITIDPRATSNSTPCPSRSRTSKANSAQLKAATPDIPVVVRGDRTNQYQVIMDVLDVLGRVGINQIALATQPSK